MDTARLDRPPDFTLVTINRHSSIFHCFRRCRCILALALLPMALPAGAQTPLSSGLQAWFKADAGVTVSAGNVTAWTDQTANAFVLTPTGAGPVFTAGSVNGLPALTFNGTQQLNGNLVTAPGDASVFALFRYTVANSDNDYLYTIGASTVSGSQLTLSRRSGQAAYHFDGSSLNVSTGDHIHRLSGWSRRKFMVVSLQPAMNSISMVPQSCGLPPAMPTHRLPVRSSSGTGPAAATGSSVISWNCSFMTGLSRNLNAGPWRTT